ncbi:MAG: hypothetical protein ACYTG0_25725 [Planctomycetota bacterium]|jgi:hypothetical protein
MTSPANQSDRPEPPEPREPPPPIQWRSWPLSENVPVAAMVVIGLLAVGLGVGWMTGRMHLALLAAGAVAAGMWRFFLPTRFQLNADGVSQRTLGRNRRIPWKAIRRYEIHVSGVLLLPDDEARPIDPFRGLFLPWGKHHREVLAQVCHYLDGPSI